MENSVDNVKANVKAELTESELTGLFYKSISRRPLIDVIQTEEEQKTWSKEFENANDITLYSWRNEWLKNIKENKEYFGVVNREKSVKVFANELRDKSVILVGAGPSLAGNLHYLKLAKEMGIKIMASHHALMYLARDEYQIKPDYVVALDAGKMWDDYFAFDKMDCSDIPLIIDLTCNIEQIKKWKGGIYFYKSNHPENSNVGKFLKMEIDRIITPYEYPSMLEVGGHVMGAMLGVARGVMSANTIIFAGADYAFDAKSNKFYPFDHKCDIEVDGKDFGQPGKMLPAPPAAHGQIYDIFGNQVFTSSSYLGFKNVMDMGIRAHKATAMSQNQDLDFINASEGGTLGALNGGNSKWMQYMRLEDSIHYAANKVKSLELQKK